MASGLARPRCPRRSPGSALDVFTDLDIADILAAHIPVSHDG